MNKKCSYCWTKAKDLTGKCSVCGIGIGKKQNELTKEERKTARYCKGMRSTAVLSLIAGIFVTLIAAMNMADSKMIALVLFLLVVGIANLYFGYSLMTYKKWCYYGSIPILGYGLIWFLSYHNIGGALCEILLLWYMLNSTSKKILFRHEEKTLEEEFKETENN